MCGIVGVFAANARDYTATVQKATSLLQHRGPDGVGLGSYHGAVLGMRRLAVIDLETGHQPISNETSTVHAVVNGEIYNYVELTSEQRRSGHVFRTRSDVETVLHAYEDHGHGLPAVLRGMFAIALFDEVRGELLLARDPFGQKPLYFAELPGGGLAFASELKAIHPLLAHAGITATISDQAIYDYLHLNFVPPPDTVFKEIQAVMPGEFVVAGRDGFRRTRYWQPSVNTDEAMRYEEALEIARDSIAESVRLCLRSDVPVGAFLSGGLDSSIIVLEAIRAGATDLTTFSVAMDDASLDESPIAARTASRLGVENVLVPVKVDPVADLHAVVRAYDQPYADSSAIAAYAVSRATSGRRKVVLTGDGGDEVFGGYRRHLAAYAASRLPRRVSRSLAKGVIPVAQVVAASLRRRSATGFALRWLQGLALPDAERYLKWTQDLLRGTDHDVYLRPQHRPTEALVEASFAGRTTPIDQQLLADAGLTLPGDMLVKMDMATSAWSLEARSPLLDHVLAENVARIPRRWLFHRRRTKALLRDAYASALSQEVTGGIKRGFEIPVAQWLEEAWRSLVHDLLLTHTARVRGYVTGEFIDAVFSGSGFGDRNVTAMRYGLLALELWLRQDHEP